MTISFQILDFAQVILSLRMGDNTKTCEQYVFVSVLFDFIQKQIQTNLMQNYSLVRLLV